MGTLRAPILESNLETTPIRRRADVRPSAVPHRFQPIVIEDVAPAVEGGEYPIKRVLGDALTITADVFKDGHDQLAAALLYKKPNDARFREAPMTLVTKGLDTYGATLRLDAMGPWTFTIEAWVDVYATLRGATHKKLAAEQSVETELIELERVVRDALSRCRKGERAWGREFDDADADARHLVESIVERAKRTRDPKVAAELFLGEPVEAFMQRWSERTLKSRHPREMPAWVDRKQARFAAWYEMFPRSEGASRGKSGTFAEAAKRLPAIAEMGFDVVYLPPIHPIGEQFRKGKNNSLEARPSDPGSPWAIGSDRGGHKSVDPALGTLDDFARFVKKARKLGMEIALDFAIQCSPDHPYVREHPEWFFHRPDGSIMYAENPPKKYQDIYPINFWGPHRDALWEELRSIVYFWIGHGIRTFRVDNPHTKPLAFWRWLIETVQADHPDVIFLAEAFTRPAPMKALAKAGFSQSYTYFTWRTTKEELVEYVTELTSSNMREYYRANFWPNTPDILHEFLVAGGEPAFKIRLVLAATLSSLYGIYSGYELQENTPLNEGSEEYLHSEKYEYKPRNWDDPRSLAPYITKLNRVRREHPALQLYDDVTFHQTDDDQLLVYSKATADRSSCVIVCVNLDPHAPHWSWVELDVAALGVSEDEEYDVVDQLTGEKWSWKGARAWIRLDPAIEPCHLFAISRRQGASGIVD